MLDFAGATAWLKHERSLDWADGLLASAGWTVQQVKGQEQEPGDTGASPPFRLAEYAEG